VSATTPDAFDRLSEKIADTVNPIVVKEVRQGLRTRVFWLFFSLMLVVNLFISLVCFATAEESANVGKGAFIAFFVVLSFVQFFIIPYTAYRPMAREAEQETWVLLTLTGIGPRRILGGKISSSVMQGSLYASAAAPFLLFSYFLNGIDLPTIIIAAFASIAYQVFLVAACVSTATLAESRLVRGLLHFVLLGGLFWCLGWGIAGGVATSELVLKFSGSEWLVLVMPIFYFVTTGLLLFEAAAARLSLPTEDYARNPRIIYLVQFTGMGMLSLVLAKSGGSDATQTVSILLSVYAALVGLFVVSDRDGMAKSHWVKGGRFSLLKPGAFRGFLFVMVSLAVACALLVALGFESASQSDMNVMLGAPGYTVFLLSASILLARRLSVMPHQMPAVTRVVFLVLLVVLTAIPPLVGEIVSDADDVFLNALNPTLGLINLEKESHDGVALLAFLWSVAGLCGIGALVSLRKRDVEWNA